MVVSNNPGPRLAPTLALAVLALLTWWATNDSFALSIPGTHNAGSENAAMPVIPSVAYDPVSEDDQERFKEIQSILKSIPTGREAMHLFEQYQVKVEFKRGRGNWYNLSSNTIVIESNKDAAEAGLALVHEMTHAARHHQGRHDHLLSLPRQAYVEQLLEEEAAAVVEEIEAKMELESAGYPVLIKAILLEDLYLAGYGREVAVATTASRNGIGERELHALGQEAGKREIIRGLIMGQAVASHGMEPYHKLYGAYWDKVNLLAPQLASNAGIRPSGRKPMPALE